jgi:hypothetical protein
MGNFQCKRKKDPRDKKTYFEYKWKGPCPWKKSDENPGPNPNPNSVQSKPKIELDLNWLILQNEAGSSVK